MMSRPRLWLKGQGWAVCVAWVVVMLLSLGAWAAESENPEEPSGLVRTRAKRTRGREKETGRPGLTGPETKEKKLSHPYLESWYDGSRNLPLATCAARTLTERDLYLFRLMRRDPESDVFQDWEKTRRPSEREELALDLEDALRALAYMFTLAESVPERQPSPDDQVFLRFLKYPVYQRVWIEKVLKPGLKLQQVDLVKYYNDHLADFYKPESVRVRYVFREVPPGTAFTEREAIEKDAQAIRAQLAAGANFVELARAKSDAPSALRGGELPRLYRGQFIEEFEDQAFALKPGEISSVVTGPGGFYVIQSLEKFPEEIKPFAAAEKKLREGAEHQALTFLYDYELLKMVRRGRHRSLAARFRSLAPEDALILVGPYRLDKRQFLNMFPNVIKVPLDLDERLLGGTATDIVRGELVAQELERQGLAGDPLLVAADQMARQIWRARTAVRAALDVPVTFNEQELRAFYEKNRELLGYQPQWRVLEIQASIRNPYLRQPSQLPAMTAELHAQFLQTLRELQTAFREERAKAAEELALSGQATTTPLSAATVPEDQTSTASLRFRRMMLARPRCLTVLSELSTTDYQYAVKDLGFRNFRDKTLYSIIEELREGDFSDIEDTSAGACTSYFVERYIPGAPEAYEKIPVHVRQQFILSQQAEVLDRLRAELERKAALRIKLPEIGSQEE